MRRLDTPAAALRQEIDSEHQRLRRLLEGRDLAVLSEQPANGKWSVAQNLRHLVFAEQVQLRRLMPAGARRDEVMTPSERDRAERMNTADAVSLDELLARLASVHNATRVLVEDDSAAVRKGLDTNLRHMRAHILTIERLLRRKA